VRRSSAVVVGAVLGAVLGALLSAVVLRPTAGELETAARELVPDGFTVTNHTVINKGWLPYEGGLTLVIARRPEPYASGTVASAATARAHGWNVGDMEQFPDADRVPVSRFLMEGDIYATGRGADGTEVWVELQRSHPLGVVALPLLFGMLLGVAGGLWLVRFRRARDDASLPCICDRATAGLGRSPCRVRCAAVLR
jgi:hypothetical protein